MPISSLCGEPTVDEITAYKAGSGTLTDDAKIIGHLKIKNIYGMIKIYIRHEFRGCEDYGIARTYRCTGQSYRWENKLGYRSGTGRTPVPVPEKTLQC